MRGCWLRIYASFLSDMPFDPALDSPSGTLYLSIPYNTALISSSTHNTEPAIVPAPKSQKPKIKFPAWVRQSGSIPSSSLVRLLNRDMYTDTTSRVVAFKTLLTIAAHRRWRWWGTGNSGRWSTVAWWSRWWRGAGEGGVIFLINLGGVLGGVGGGGSGGHGWSWLVEEV